MADNANLQDGDWVQPAWNGHAFYGQTGQVIGTSNSGDNWLIDVDGDGATDYFLSKTGSHNAPSNLHAGKLAEDTEFIVNKAGATFDVIFPIVVAVVALSVLLTFVKRLRQS